MEDNQFWDELANRLRQEQAQTFREGDWAAVHQRIRVKGKRRAAWFWPLIAGLVLIGNNLIWYLLLPQAATPSTQAPVAMQCDTVVLIRERVVRDTVWQKMPAPAFKQAEQSPLQSPQAIPALHQAFTNTVTIPEALPAFAINSAGHDPGMDTSSRVPNAALYPLRSRRFGLETPFTVSIIPAGSGNPRVAKRETSLLIAADVGGSIFFSENVSGMHLWQAGATLYLMPGKLGSTFGVRSLYATENPSQTGPELGWTTACPSCPASPDFPDRVSLQWTEFQMGLAYRFALPYRKKTEILLSAVGQLRSPIAQYRHLRFENYGGPLVEVDDRSRQESGLYWNGWSSSVSVVHRIARNFGVSGSLEGRWTDGVNPGLMPASVGVRAGLVWYAR
ncbi:MAG: hypothetical protein ACKV1O_01620 [Saprospiraceae bacterium]